MAFHTLWKDAEMKMMVEEKYIWESSIWGNRSHSNQWPVAKSPRWCFSRTRVGGKSREAWRGFVGF